MKYLEFATPASKHAQTLKSDYKLTNHGVTNLDRIYWNLPNEALYEEIVFRGEGHISHQGPIIVNTGKHTARAASDKCVVREQTSEDDVWWGVYNRPISAEKFSQLHSRMMSYLQGEEVFVQDCYAGADEEHKLPVRIITEYAWHSLFARNMLITINNPEELRKHVPEFTIICCPKFKADPRVDGTRSETFIAVNFAQRLALIGGTGYAGEIKKTVFTVMNYLLPKDGVLPMHCSANVGKEGDVALFFGLSGTGKTTLSADPKRFLIGDDEHGWSDQGVFNFEAGCYAKVIRLSAEHEPEIYACTRRFGTVLENVVWDPATRLIDLDDEHITENTRASYPLEFIANAVPDKRSDNQPKNIIFLTCDASGVMPPIAKLTPEQAMYHFISGYTSKIAGTEIGLGIEPQITFSACFGAPFMVHHPYEYANLLRKKMLQTGAQCWLVNTGWVGGPFGIGKRISIRHTRNLLTAALEGNLAKVKYRKDQLFGFEVPLACPDVPEDVLDPSNSWGNKDEYWRKYDALAARFIENFKLFAEHTTDEVQGAGPKRVSQIKLKK